MAATKILSTPRLVVNTEIRSDICSRNPQERFWIGLHNRQHTEQWLWTDGTPLRYRNWHVEQRNVAETRTRTDPKCASVWHGCSVAKSCGLLSMNGESYGKWTGDECTKQYPAVCRKPVKTTINDVVNHAKKVLPFMGPAVKAIAQLED